MPCLCLPDEIPDDLIPGSLCNLRPGIEKMDSSESRKDDCIKITNQCIIKDNSDADGCKQTSHTNHNIL